MRVILKPGGVFTILAVIFVLTGLLFVRNKQTSASPSDASTPAAQSSGSQSPSGDAIASSKPSIAGGMEVPITDDAYVAAAAFADDTRKQLGYILVKTPATEDNNHHRIGYLKASLSQLPGDSVKTAKLAFSVNRIDASLRTKELNGSKKPEITVYGLDDCSWTSDRLTWNSQPAPSGYTKLGSVELTGNGWYTVDITDYVNKRLKGDRMAGFRISDDNKTDMVIGINGCRSTTNQPYLLITQ